MTRYEYIQKANLVELAQVLCDISDSVDFEKIKDSYRNCEGCVATDMCSKGNNGFREWLMQEARVNENNRLMVE